MKGARFAVCADGNTANTPPDELLHLHLPLSCQCLRDSPACGYPDQRAQVLRGECHRACRRRQTCAAW